MTRFNIAMITLLTGWLVFFFFRKRNAFKRDLVSITNDEWNNWGRQYSEQGHTVIEGGLEYEEPYAQVVRKYWQAVGYNYDGYDRDKAWSGAFISYILKKAGAKGFQGAISHSEYIRRAVATRKRGDLKDNFVAYRVREKTAEVGDLICYSRGETENDPYDRTSSYTSHCDLVVKKGSNYVDVIGGNVGQSVTKKKVPTSDGKVYPLHDKWFAIIKNNQKF
tara:strand:+ start:4641 stop:5303 length:663 start_codon:yes stop_codon:yes gene_type:complete